MKFTVTILGCGSAVPTLYRNPTAQVVNVREQLFLVDCGEGTQIQLRRFKIKFQRINQIFISHLHGDHFFGLVGLLSTYQLLGRTKDLTVFGPAGLEVLMRSQLEISGKDLSYNLRFVEVDPTQHKTIFQDTNLQVESIPLKHKIPCCGYLFREKEARRKLLPAKLKKYGVSIAYADKIKDGLDIRLEDGIVIENKELSTRGRVPKSYAFCSDTAYSEDLVKVIEGVDALYHEATFLDAHADRASATMHSTAKQAATIALKAGVGKLILGHYSARYPSSDDFRTEATEIFEHVTCAEDGLTIIVD